MRGSVCNVQCIGTDLPTQQGRRGNHRHSVGSVTVAEDGTITVDALNTKGTAIKVVLHKQQTAIGYQQSDISNQPLES